MRLRFGEFIFDPGTRQLRRGEEERRLGPKAFELLELLLQRRPNVVGKKGLRDHLWPGTFVSESTLATVVGEVRAALADDPKSPRFLRTVHGVGYAFCGEATSEDPAMVGDSADAPQFVETVPRRGYRFVASVGSSDSLTDSAGKRRWPRVSFVVIGLVTALITFLAVGAWVSFRGRPGIATSPPHIRSLAVLPFKNLTGDPAQEYFADGMTDAVSGTFSQLGGLTVVSSTSSGRYKDSPRPARQIAEDLGVDALLEGAVLRSGSRVRVSVALIHAAADRRLWAQTYDRELADVLTLYAEIAQAAVRETSLVLSDSQLGQLARPRTVNTEAYDEFLKGTYFMSRWMAGGCPKAEKHFRRSIELDSTFANPHAELVWCYVFPDRMQRPVAELAPRARALTARAMELNPSLASAHVGLGLIRQFIDYDWDAAEQAFRRALELDPGSAIAHNAYGDLLYMRGRPDESIPMLSRAVQLDPFSPDRNVGLAFGMMNVRRYDEAIERLRSALELDPAYATAQYWLAQTLDLKGDRDGAVSAYLVWLDEVVVPQRASRARADLESAYARSGWQAFWRRELELAEEEAARPGAIWKPPYNRYAGPAFMALRYARLGQRDLAFAFLEKAHEARHHLIASLNSNPLWDGIRSDPRFRQLVQRIGLSPS